MSIKITDLADLIWRDELNQTTVTNIPSISYWLRNTGMGKLNDLIHSTFTIDDITLEILPSSAFTINEAVILVQLYLIKFFQLQSNNFLGASGINDITEYSENGMTIRKLNRTEQSKVWLQLVTEAKKDLKDLITGYKIGKATPVSIEGQELLLLSTMLPRYNRVINGGN